MRTAFIGTGSMGSILIDSAVQSGAVQAENVICANRTVEKAQEIARRYPGMQVAMHNREAVLERDIVFLCIKPLEFKEVLDEIREAVDEHQIIVSITSPVLVRQLEEQLPCKIAKVIPSITNFESSGATLCVYGERMNKQDRERLEQLLRSFSTPIRIPEMLTRVASDLSSCGPAFLSFFVQKFVDAAVIETGMPRELANRLVSEMMLGTGQLLTGGGFTPETLQQRVSVPGGVTAEGLRMLQHELNDVFHELIRTTHAKYRDDVDKVHSMFYGSRVD